MIRETRIPWTTPCPGLLDLTRIVERARSTTRMPTIADFVEIVSEVLRHTLTSNARMPGSPVTHHR
jgi:hypothetical protein